MLASLKGINQSLTFKSAATVLSAEEVTSELAQAIRLPDFVPELRAGSDSPMRKCLDRRQTINRRCWSLVSAKSVNVGQPRSGKHVAVSLEDLEVHCLDQLREHKRALTEGQARIV